MAFLRESGPDLEQAFDAIETLERGERVDPDTLHLGLRALFNTPAQSYLAEMIRFDPAATLHELGESDDALPVLIVHDGRDIQIADADARPLADVRPDAQLVVIADMNHVLKRVAYDNRDANVATYSNPHLPIMPDVVDAMAEFVTKTHLPC